MMRFVILVALVSGLVIGVGGVQAQDTCTFDVTSGDWDVDLNWDCGIVFGHEPTAADRAVATKARR